MGTASHRSRCLSQAPEAHQASQDLTGVGASTLSTAPGSIGLMDDGLEVRSIFPAVGRTTRGRTHHSDRDRSG